MPIRRLWRKSDMRGSKRKNTKRENRLEELGRVDAEKAYTSKGKRNLKAEKKRIVREVSSRGAAKIEKVAKKADKNFKKLAESKETQLHSKDAMEGFDRAEKRASSEAMQDYKKMAKGGRAGFKVGGAAKRGISKILRKK